MDLTTLWLGSQIYTDNLDSLLSDWVDFKLTRYSSSHTTALHPGNHTSTSGDTQVRVGYFGKIVNHL
jgi:hypothetical protein